MSDLPKLRAANNGPTPQHAPGISGTASHRDLSARHLADALRHRRALPKAALNAALARSLTGGPALELILVQDGLLPERDVLAARAALDGCSLIDLDRTPPDETLKELVSAEAAIALGAVPHGRIAGRLVVATHRPDLFAEIRAALPNEKVKFALAPRAEIDRGIHALYGGELARRAEIRAPLEASCRVWGAKSFLYFAAATGAAAATFLAIAPTLFLYGVMAIAGIVFLANMALKIAAGLAGWRSRFAPQPARHGVVPLHREPIVTILVPLFRERDVAGQLLQRLQALDYPRAKLDVIFILEEGDGTTRRALDACELPHWARAITVPPGQPQTKPRALNYALPFSRGTVIGIYDAEDLPEPDQLRRVVSRFADAGPDVACLQGQLDYYNAQHNWMSRCFTIEYATWFRLLLPGVARLGLVVPLGGTTLFLKRQALLEVDAWDAHNVTEDAELGLRLARSGYRTELLDTTTYEEANSELWPWIKQRSRWLKGYAITWATAMRQPRRLWRDLGPRRFFGVQIQLGGTVLGFLTAPLIWSLAFIPLGLPHPMAAPLGAAGGTFLGWIFALSLLITLGFGWLGCQAGHLRRHRIWLPSLLAYFPLASFALVVALGDLIFRPFHWIKTAHGRYGARSPSASSIAAAASSLSRTAKAVDKCETRAR